MKILEKTSADRDWITEYLNDLWSGTTIILPSGRYDAATLPAFYTEDQDVVLTYHLGDKAEIVTFNIPFGYDHQPVNDMLAVLADKIKQAGYDALYATATNDNSCLMEALQRAGFRYHGIYTGAVDKAREEHADIPTIGRNDVPMHDEIEFILQL